MENKNAELGLLAAKLLARELNILLELLDGVLECGTGVVNLVNDQNTLANEASHLAKGAEVEPLCARNFGPWLFDVGVVGCGQLLVERQAYGLDGNIGVSGALEERSQNACRNIAAAANGDHQLGVDFLKELGCSFLAQLVDLYRRSLSVSSSSTWGAQEVR